MSSADAMARDYFAGLSRGDLIECAQAFRDWPANGRREREAVRRLLLLAHVELGRRQEVGGRSEKAGRLRVAG